MKKQIDAPANWQDFEDLCHKLWRSIWNDPDTQKNGRQGQEQHGVDVFGLPNRSDKYYGVQCKGKKRGYGERVTENELRTEADKAKLFKPEIGRFILATTVDGDAKIQEIARKATIDNTYGFPVSVWSWEMISSELQSRPEVYKSIYHEELDKELQSTTLTLGRFDDEDMIFTYLSRPFFDGAISDSLKRALGFLMYELVDNCFRHSESSYVTIHFDNNEFLLEYDGSMYDINNLLSEDDKRGGAYTYSQFLALCGEGLTTAFSFEKVNIFRLSFSDNVLKKDIGPIEIEYPSSNMRVLSREKATKDVYGDIQYIKRTGLRVKILIRQNCSLSGFGGCVDVLLKHVAGQIESVSVPGEEYATLYADIFNQLGIPVNVR